MSSKCDKSKTVGNYSMSNESITKTLSQLYYFKYGS